MSKILSFKSNLRFSSWIVLASFLSIPLATAMTDEQEEKKLSISQKFPKGPLETYNLVTYINDFLPDERDQRAMSGVCKLFRRVVKNRANKPHEAIKEEMKKLGQPEQQFVRDLLGHKVACDKHAHFEALKFLYSFNQDSGSPTKYKSLYQRLLKYNETHKTLPLSKIHWVRLI